MRWRFRCDRERRTTANHLYIWPIFLKPADVQRRVNFGEVSRPTEYNELAQNNVYDDWPSISFIELQVRGCRAVGPMTDGWIHRPPTRECAPLVRIDMGRELSTSSALTFVCMTAFYFSEFFHFLKVPHARRTIHTLHTIPSNRGQVVYTKRLLLFFQCSACAILGQACNTHRRQKPHRRQSKDGRSCMAVLRGRPSMDGHSRTAVQGRPLMDGSSSWTVVHGRPFMDGRPTTVAHVWQFFADGRPWPAIHGRPSKDGRSWMVVLRAWPSMVCHSWTAVQ